MKQKERLAKEYSETVDNGWNARSESYKAYLKGFEEAKRLMLKRDYISIFEAAHVRDLGEKDAV